MVKKYTVSVISTMEQNRNITGLLYALNNKKDPDIRNRAIDALGRLRSAEAADALLEILKKDKDETAQERAIFALGILKEKRAWNPILEILKNSKEPENVRWASAEAISYYEDIRAVEPLLDALEYAKGEVLIGVILSLGRLKDRRALGPLVTQFEKELTKSFNFDEDWLVLINTAIAFQNFDDPRTIKSLSKALKFDHRSFPNCGGRCGDLQREALNALGKISDKRAFDVLTDILESGAKMLKWDCVNVLKNIENKKVLAPLYKTLQTNQDNEAFVEEVQNAISEVERNAGETCYFCGEDCDTREILIIDMPTNRKICQTCWNDIKHEQGNPDTRTVIECGWDDEDRNAGALEECAK